MRGRPSLMPARWVDHGVIFFVVCGPKYISLPVHCAGVSVVCNVVFQLTMSCCVPEIFAIKSRSCPKSRRNLHVFGPPNLGKGRDHPNIWPNFINLGHHRTCGQVWWRSAKRPRRLGGEKRKTPINYSGKTEWPAASIAGRQPGQNQQCRVHL